MLVPQHNMKLKVVILDPATAAQFLEKNHPNNRKKKWGKIEMYANDMRAKMWRLNHQAIAFDEDGFMTDGQNRCEACILADAEVPITIISGVPRNGIFGVDQNSVRTVADVARIKGDPLPFGATNYAGCARKMMTGNKYYVVTHQELLAFAKTNKEALAFAFDCLPKNIRGLTHAALRAVIARAFYHGNHKKVRDFCRIYLSGIPDDPEKDVAAIRLRNFMLMSIGGKRGSKTGMRVQPNVLYAKSENALKNFIDRKFIDKIYETSKEMFPLPGEDEDDDGDEEATLLKVS